MNAAYFGIHTGDEPTGALSKIESPKQYHWQQRLLAWLIGSGS
jgi:hypothetical protein